MKVWGVTGVLVGVLATGASAQDLTSLRGHWQLNRPISDVSTGIGDSDARRPAGGRAPMGGPFGGPAGGAPVGGMGGRAPMDQNEMRERTALLVELMAPHARLLVDVEGDVVTFTGEDGHRASYRTNWRAEKHQAINGSVETRTRWRRGVLERETRLDAGFRITETFALDADTGQLIVMAQLRGGRFGGERRPVRRVYDRAESMIDRE
jgi:hypothetical protein